MITYLFLKSKKPNPCDLGAFTTILATLIADFVLIVYIALNIYKFINW